MKSYIALTSQGPGQIAIDTQALGRGGEGTVYAVQSHSLPDLPPADKLVMKIYHNALEDNRLNKVRAMVTAPPLTTSVAWPLAVVFNQDKTFAGYVMMKLASKTYRPWAELAHARQRRESASSFDVRYGITAVRNLAVAIDSVHQAGHRIGDLNESNIFIGGDASVLLIDTDSAQVRGRDQIFPCLVGKPEYTAAEISHGPLRTHERTVETDVFGFAVAAYQMLTGGAHPTDAVYGGEGEPPSVVEKIRYGVMPGLNASANDKFQHPPRIPAQAIPTAIRGMLFKALSPLPDQRPTVELIITVLDQTLPHLVQCARVKHHWYDDRDGYCGWCAHAEGGRPDPWSDLAATQQNLPKQFVLPAVDFGDGQQGPVQVRRAPAAPAGASAHPQAPPAHQSPTGGQAAYPAPPQQPQASYPPAGQGQPPPPPQKGGKTIVNYADGTSGPRPALGVLFKANPKLALSCLKSETPDAARFWWPPSRALASPLGLLGGMAIAFIFAVLWAVFTVPVLTLLDLQYAVAVWAPAGFLAGLGAFLSGTLLTFSGFWDRRRARKSAGGRLDNFTPESPPRTLARYAGLSLIYGPGLVLGLILVLIMVAFNVVAALIKDGSKYR